MCNTHKIEWHSGMFCAIERGLINCFLQVNVRKISTQWIQPKYMNEYNELLSNLKTLLFTIAYDLIKLFLQNEVEDKTVCFICLLY